MKHETKVYLHTAPVRVWHWCQALAICILLLTGIRIRFVEAMSFISLKHAVTVHNYVAFIFVVLSVLWLVWHLITGAIAGYFSNPLTIVPRIFIQAKYYAWGFFHAEPNPHKAEPGKKFNPLQQVTYAVFMFVILPAQMISGLLLWKVEHFDKYTSMLGGVKIADTIHVMLSYLLVLFLIVHGYLITLGKTPTAHLKSMIDGWHEHE
jgi:thiosulfate reductase cytochrome b subunit